MCWLLGAVHERLEQRRAPIEKGATDLVEGLSEQGVECVGEVIGLYVRGQGSLPLVSGHRQHYGAGLSSVTARPRNAPYRSAAALRA